MALRAGGFPGLCELRSVRVGMAILANLRCPFELRLVRTGRRLMTGTAGNCPVGAQKRELGFRMIEATYVRPRLRVVTGLATERGSIRATPGHALFKFAVVRINVAGRAALILEMEGEHLVRRAACACLVTLVARHRHVRARQREACLLMNGYCKRGAMKILNGVATLAAVLIRRGGELPFVNIFVAVQAGGEFHLVNSILPRWNVALIALNDRVLAQQGILRRGMLFHAKE